jgi:RNA methyltransferase
MISMFQTLRLKAVSRKIVNMNLLLLMGIAAIMNSSVTSMNASRKPAAPRPTTKDGFHIRNKHRNRYDFQFLKSTNPELVSFVAVNKYGDESIEFSNPLAVTALNKVGEF